MIYMEKMRQKNSTYFFRRVNWEFEDTKRAEELLKIV